MTLWVNRYDGPANGNDYPSALVMDHNNDIIVTGASQGNGTIYDYATIKYSSAGVPQWTNRYDGPAHDDDEAWAVAVDTSNNVFVTGYSWNGANYDYATLKYSSAGVPLWTNRYNGPANGDDKAWAVAVDASNNVLVTGESHGLGTGWDSATLEYSNAGVPLWTNRYNGPANGDDGGWAVTIDHNNNPIVAGFSSSGGPYTDFAAIKYVAGSVPSPVLTALGLTNGSFQVRVDNVLQSGTLVLQASTNLQSWTPVFTNTTPTNMVFYADPNTAGHLWRFYRALQFP
jgi:hypothetical protein